MMLTRDALLKTNRPAKVLRLQVPELAVEGADAVFIRQLSLDDACKWRATLSDEAKPLADRIRGFVAAILCNESGLRILDDADAAALGALPAADVERIYLTGLAFNRLRNEDTDAALAEAKKNLEPTP